MNIKGAIFDMDGTLINSLIFWDVLWEEFGNRYLGGERFYPDLEADKAIRTMVLAEAMDHYHERFKIGESGADLLNTANEVFKDCYVNRVELKDGVKEFLDYLKAKGVKMCVASATDKALLVYAMERCGLYEYFDTILSCADVGKGKDQPDIYYNALEVLGTDMDNTWVFEDSYVALRTANGMGLNTVGIYDKFNFDQDKMEKLATHYIADGETLMKLVK
ncbi:MAG: HAD family phosphatase [Oscillospiraceae bacterium]|nr:HAD family phosphatase [Oscillospiraceae bacterium]